MATSQPGLTAAGKIIIFLMVVGLIGGGIYVALQMEKEPDARTIDISKLHEMTGGGAKTPAKDSVEAPDLSGITTVQEYAYVPASTLPKVKGVSGYKWDEKNKVVQFSLNVWIGWLPIVAANHGFAANEESIFFKDHGFKVELRLIDDPVAARDAYATGDVHVLWGTMDMMVLFAEGLMKDSRTAPRIVQLIDWSNGGDGVVARKNIRSVRDLKGKKIVCAKNSPSEYFITSLLINAGIQPKDVEFRFTATAFEASAAFVADPSLSACVSWAPDIYNIPDRLPGTHLMTSTADANKLIADVWAVRADFAKDHPDIVAGLVEGIFKGMDQVAKNSADAVRWMSEGYGFPEDEIRGMMADAHSTNFNENKTFFLNKNNPANFERTWQTISYVYRELGSIGTPTRFDQVMDFSIIQSLEEKGTFQHQKDTYVTKFVPHDYRKVTAEAPILTQVIKINFFPNSANLFELARDDFGNRIEGKLYDPNVNATAERAGRLAGQFEAAVIAITGHTDASMKGKVSEKAVLDLSERRAEAVRQALIERFKFDPNKFVVKGVGWGEPFDPADPNNHAQNRRVEISVFQPESD